MFKEIAVCQHHTLNNMLHSTVYTIVSNLKNNKQPQLLKERSYFKCFIVDLLTQHKLCCVNLIISENMINEPN